MIFYFEVDAHFIDVNGMIPMVFLMAQFYTNRKFTFLNLNVYSVDYTTGTPLFKKIICISVFLSDD